MLLRDYLGNVRGIHCRKAYKVKVVNLSNAGCNIGFKTLFSERGKLTLKLTCPTGTSTCPATMLNKGEIGLCPKQNLPSGASQGLVQLAPLPFLPNSLVTGPVVMLHTTMLTLLLSKARGCKISEKHLNPVVLVFIGKLLLSSLRLVISYRFFVSFCI